MRQKHPQKPLHESAASAAVSTGVLQASWHCDLKHTILVNEARQAVGRTSFDGSKKWKKLLFDKQHNEEQASSRR